MKNISKPTLIQIHYHNRAGGVTRVMKSYANEFRNVFGSRSTNLILCHSEEKCNEIAANVINISACEYHCFRSKEAFLKTRATLIRQIEKVLLMKGLTSPIIIICHNLNLGKNPALSAAVSMISRKLPHDKFKFFLVVHDMAEDGRAEIIQTLRFYKQNEIDIKRELFMVGSGTKLLTLNTPVCNVLRECGFNVSVLPNPIKYSTANKEKNILNKNGDLEGVLKKEFPYFDQLRKTYYYPARIIARKNIFEAIALVNCVLNGNLILGKNANTVAGKSRKKKIEELIAKFKLPILVDSENVFRSGVDRSLMINNIDYYISTSISEGFGYALHEPWIYRKWLVGRKPEGFESSYGIDLKGLYEFFPVPSKWIDTKMLIELYIAGYEKCFGPARYRDAISELFRQKYIDFGMLDEKSQIAVICLVNERLDMKKKWIEILKAQYKGWPGLDSITSIDGNLISKNGRILERADVIFRDKFYEIMTSNRSSFEDPDFLKLEQVFYKIKKCPILMMAT